MLLNHLEQKSILNSCFLYRNSLIKYLLKVHQGLKGHVKDANGNMLPEAEVIVEGNDKSVVTSSRGEYWRILLPGVYQVKAKYQNEVSEIKSIEVLENEVKIIDFQIGEYFEITRFIMGWVRV